MAAGYALRGSVTAPAPSALPAGSRPTGVALSESRVVVAAEGAGVLLFDREELMQTR